MNKPVQDTRLGRAKVVLAALAGAAAVASCVLAFVGPHISEELGALIRPLALILGGGGGLVIHQGWPGLDELKTQKLVLRSGSKLYHALQYGVAIASAGIAMSTQVLLHVFVPDLPWPPSLTIIVASGIAIGLLASAFVSRRLGRWIGVGVRAA